MYNPELPSFRVENVGIDMAGPLLVKGSDNKSDTYKEYVVLFTCAATRAVHLELATSLSVKTFICLRGFALVEVCPPFLLRIMQTPSGLYLRKLLAYDV